MEKRHSMNMLSMRRTSNLKSFDNSHPQCSKVSAEAAESSQNSISRPERMSIEMEDKDTSVKKK